MRLEGFRRLFMDAQVCKCRGLCGRKKRLFGHATDMQPEEVRYVKPGDVLERVGSSRAQPAAASEVAWNGGLQHRGVFGRVQAEVLLGNESAGAPRPATFVLQQVPDELFQTDTVDHVCLVPCVRTVRRDHQLGMVQRVRHEGTGLHAAKAQCALQQTIAELLSPSFLQVFEAVCVATADVGAIEAIARILPPLTIDDTLGVVVFHVLRDFGSCLKHTAAALLHAVPPVASLAEQICNVLGRPVPL